MNPFVRLLVGATSRKMETQSTQQVTTKTTRATMATLATLEPLDPRRSAGRARAQGENESENNTAIKGRPLYRSATRAINMYQALPTGYVLMQMLCFFLATAPAAAVCPHCKDCIAGCPGGDACPLVAELTENVRVFEAGALGTTPTVQHLLPPTIRAVFTPAMCEALVGITTAPSGGTTADLSNLELYPTCMSVVRAARFGHCSVEEGVMELSARTETADEAEMARIKAAVEMIKAVGGNALTGIQGVYTFIWAKTGQLVSRAAESIRLTTSSTSNRLTAAELTVALKRPGTEWEFFERIHLFVWVLVSLGIVNFTVIMKFITEAIHAPRRRLNLGWQVTHELFILYLDRIETDVSRMLNFANVIDRGMFDTLLAQAKANEVICFRTRGENPRAGAPVNKWNGKFNEKSERPCMAFNNGTEHGANSLDSDGTCRFNHICMQWVSDKGPRGICGGKHAKGECTYDVAKKLDGPRK